MKHIYLVMTPAHVGNNPNSCFACELKEAAEELSHAIGAIVMEVPYITGAGYITLEVEKS